MRVYLGSVYLLVRGLFSSAKRNRERGVSEGAIFRVAVGRHMVTGTLYKYPIYIEL